MASKSPRRSESSAGFHFVNLYQCCPRKWYFRYLKGWRPKMTARPLIQGSAFHEAKAAWYRGKSESSAIKASDSVLEESRSELAEEDYLDLQYRLPILIHKWIEAFGKSDRESFRVIAVEEELVVPVGLDFSMTIRPDTILQSKTDPSLILIMETKTSGFSHRLTEEGVRYGDQATAYLWGVRKATNIPAYAVVPDIAYWNRITRSPDNIKMTRGDLIFRDEYRTARFEKGILQLFSEMSQKAEAYRSGFDPWLLFPRNSHYCLSFSTPCDFAEICGQDCESMKRVPSGFKKVGGLARLGDYVLDPIAIT